MVVYLSRTEIVKPIFFLFFPSFMAVSHIFLLFLSLLPEEVVVSILPRDGPTTFHSKNLMLYVCAILSLFHR